MDATRAEDAPNASRFEEMDPERRRFLEEALRSLTVNVVEQLEMAVKTIMNENSSEDEILNALEVISDYVQDIDAANDFFKVGGFCILDPCLSSPHSTVKSASLRLVRDLAQNNPFCQEKLLEHGTLNQLIDRLSDPADQVASDAMSAVSAIVRAFEPGLEAFLDIGGLECMLGCLEDGTRVKLQIRVAFLISTITSENPHLVNRFVQLNAVERLATHLEVPTMDQLEDQNQAMKAENFLSALSSLTAEEEGASRVQCSALNLADKLERIIKTVAGREEFEEVTDFASRILERVARKDNKEDQADR